MFVFGGGDGGGWQGCGVLVKCKVILLGKASSCSGKVKIYCDVLVEHIMNSIFATTLCLVPDEIILSLVNWWWDCYVALMAPAYLDLISHLMSFNEAWIGNIRLLSLEASTGCRISTAERKMKNGVNNHFVFFLLSSFLIFNLTCAMS